MSSNPSLLTQRPLARGVAGENLNVAMDFGALNEFTATPPQTIVSATVTYTGPDTALVLGNFSGGNFVPGGGLVISGTRVYCGFGLRTSGSAYTVTVAIVTSGGQTRERQGVVQVM